jgi:HK97 family phage major capsid protein
MAARMLEFRTRAKEIKAEIGQLLQASAKDKRPLTETEAETSETLQAELDLVAATMKAEEKFAAYERDEAPAAESVAAAPAAARAAEGANPWRSFGEFLCAVANVSIKGEVDPRLIGPGSGVQGAASGLNATVPSEGGFLVRQDFSTMLLEKAMTESVLAPDCTPINIGEGFDGIELPYIDETSRATGSRWGGVQVYRRAEADTVTATKPKLGKLEIRLEDMMAICYLTGRSVQDAAALESIVSSAFASEFAFKIDDEIVNGTGAGQCLGLLNSPATVVQTKESGQASNTFAAGNVQQMFARLPGRNLKGAKWYINQEVWPQLFKMNQANMPIFLPGFNLASAPFGTLLGLPIVPNIEQLPGLTTKGDVLLADLRQYLLIKKGGVDAQSSMHVRFLFDEMTYRFIQRINGAPAWKTTLTPYKATANTAISPFVVVETR